MSFFVRGNRKNINETDNGFRKRKNDDSGKRAPPTFNKKAGKKRNNKHQDEDEEIDSDFEDNCVEAPDVESEEDFLETAQEKRLRLAKVYLGEIECEEKERADSSVIDRDIIANRLNEDFLESAGKLKKRVADNYTGYDASNIGFLKCKEQKQSITCIVVSSDNLHIYSGSKDCTIVKWSLTERKKIKVIPRCKKGSKDTNSGHMTTVQCLAISTDNSFLVSGGGCGKIFVWKPATMEKLHVMPKAHRKGITGLVFRRNTHQLFSASQDRSVRVWSLDEMAYVETLFGHQSAITSIDALNRDRAITSGGTDNSVRIWKVVEQSQLIFLGHQGSIDGVKLISEEHFLTCSDDGDLCVWGTMKKRPLSTRKQAHGTQHDNQLPNWITSIATFLNTDLIASGSRDGMIRVWKCSVGYRDIVPLMEVPVPGFINSLAFSADGKQLIAGVGQEHRLGRWWKESEARNVVVVIPFVINKDVAA